MRFGLSNSTAANAAAARNTTTPPSETTRYIAYMDNSTVWSVATHFILCE